MTLWIAWSVLISALLAAAAAVLERAASYLGAPRRFVWIAAVLAATVVPVAMAARRAPVDEAPRALGKAMPTPSLTFTAQPRTETNESVIQTSRAFAGWTSIARRADRWLVTAWLCASGVLLLLFVRELVCLRRHQSSWDTVDTDMGVVLVARNIGPAVVGFFHPRIVVPSWTLSADRATRALLHRHELEHIRAGDTRALLASELALILVPWNAALWWMTRRLRLAIELDCDARVVRAIGGAHAYASVLLSVGERHSAGGPLTTSFSGSRLNLEVRIDAMTAPRKRYPVASALPLAAIALGVLATAAWMPRPVPLGPARDVHTPVKATPASAREPHPLPGNRPPRYPEARRASGTDGYVIVGFSVDALGHPDASTIHIFSATDSLFADAVRAVVPSWRYDSSGVKRQAVRFLTTVTERAERSAGRAAPVYMVDGEPLTAETIVVTTLFWGQSSSPSQPPPPVGDRPRPTNAEAQQGQEPRVTLSLENSPIMNVLDEFSKYSHRTILTTRYLTGTVTAEVRDQPWQSALRSVLNANGYDFAVATDRVLIVDTIDEVRQAVAARDRWLGREVRDTTLAGVGYAARKQAGDGVFLDGNQIDPRASTFSDMLRTVPGFRIAPSADGRAQVISDAQSTPGGCVNFFVDGALWQTTMPGDIDTVVRPAQVVAVEAYKSSSTPPQFAPQNQSQCATIVVWTRARVRPD